MEVNTQERRTEIDYANITFESVFSETGQVVKVYFVVKRDTESFKADNHAFLKIDNFSFRADFDQVNVELQTKVDSSTSSVSSTDSTGTTTTNIYSNSTYSWIDEKFAFRLNGEMISSLKSANSFVIRIYFGPIPATFRINDSNLNLIKKALRE